MEANTWTQLRQDLRTRLDAEEFSTWFEPLEVDSENDAQLVLKVPNARFLQTLEDNFRTVLNRTVADLKGGSFQIFFRICEDLDLTLEKNSAPIPVQTLPFNKNYTFETFVVGNSNQFARAAALAVADSPCRSYNPLFLYGGVGLGKTHLLHAIANRIHDTHSHLKIMYLAAEQFVNELINSIRFDRMPDFRDRYRNIDVLLIDDIQFIANKERTQEEFFHTFNTLYTSQKQIILSSDSSPRKIPTLEERLRSRFEWGLIADIQPPELETKVAILRRKADLEGIDLPDEVAHFVARQVRSNIRELEGLLTRVTAFSELTDKPLSVELAKETLKDILPSNDRRSTASEIVKHVARHYGLKVSEIKSRNNSRPIVFPRKVAMYLLRHLTDMSFPEIGRLFNNKHHSTVMTAVKDIELQRADDVEFDRVLESIQHQFV